jgi:zinc transport system substrate-binding protein
MKRFCLLLLLAFVLPQPVPAESNGLSMFVSIPPQKYLLEQIGGGHIDSQVMLGPGANPHNYDPSPRKLAQLARARTYFTIGVPFEQMWQSRLQAVNPEIEFIHCGADLSDHHAHHHSQHEHHDPHIWTSPVETQAISECMLASLLRLDPRHASIYITNHDRLQQDLQRLHDEITLLLESLTTRYILVQHPAWDYFADTYGFEQISIEQDGHEPHARHLARVIEFARSHGMKTVFAQPQYSIATAQLVADAIGGRVVELDPLAENYIENMRQVAHAIAAAGQRDE